MHAYAGAGATEVSSKQRQTNSAQPSSKAQPAATPFDTANGSPAEGQLAGQIDPASFRNATCLHAGQTEVLVAPGVRPVQGQTQSVPIEAEPFDTSEAGGGDAAGGDLVKADASGCLDLQLDDDSDAVISDSDQAASGRPGEVQQPDKGGLAEAESEPPHQQKGTDADKAEDEQAVADDDLDMHSIMSDGDDSYQGLPDDALAPLGTFTHQEILTDEAASSVATLVATSSAVPGDKMDHEQQQQQQQVSLQLVDPSTIADALPGEAADQANMLAFKPQHAQHDTIDPAASMEIEHQQHFMAANEADGISGSRHSETVPSDGTSLAEAQSDTQVEIHHSQAPGLWCWQAAFLQDPGLPETGFVAVTCKLLPSDKASSSNATLDRSELVEVERLRSPPPVDTYLKSVSGLHRGAVLEIDLGDGKFVCAVFIAGVKPSYGPWVQRGPKQLRKRAQRLDSILSIAQAQQAASEAAQPGEKLMRIAALSGAYSRIVQPGTLLFASWIDDYWTLHMGLPCVPKTQENTLKMTIWLGKHT